MPQNHVGILLLLSPVTLKFLASVSFLAVFVIFIGIWVACIVIIHIFFVVASVLGEVEVICLFVVMDLGGVTISIVVVNIFFAFASVLSATDLFLVFVSNFGVVVFVDFSIECLLDICFSGTLFFADKFSVIIFGADVVLGGFVSVDCCTSFITFIVIAVAADESKIYIHCT